MNVPPFRSDEPEQQHAMTLRERRRQALLSLSTVQLSSNPSWGERLLPYLLVAMETCWVDVLLIGAASLGVFQSHDTLIPLWAPFVFMAGSYWLTTHMERRALAREAGVSEHNNSGTVLVFMFIAVVTLFVVWSSVYTSAGFFLDPRWVGDLLNDLLLLDGTAFRVAAILALAVYFCWRGIRISCRDVEPADVFKGLRAGAIVLLIVVIVRAGINGTFFDELPLLLLIPLFLSFSLVAHALSQALFMRRSHIVGLQGSVIAQERSLLTIVGGVGVLLLLIALLVGTIASSQFLAQLHHVLSPLGAAYDVLASGIAYAIVFLLTPFFWLISMLHPRTQLPTPRQHLPPSNPGFHQTGSPPPLLVASIPFIKLLLPLVFVAVLVIAILAVLRPRRVELKRRNDDQHESLWSWQLFWTQLKAFLLALWRHFFPPRTVEAVQQVQLDELPVEPAARTIREIYRAFLQWAASRGYQRKKDETPSEFKARLDTHVPMVESEVGVVTDAYNAIRYGGVMLDDAEVRHVQQVWMELQQKV